MRNQREKEAYEKGAEQAKNENILNMGFHIEADRPFTCICILCDKEYRKDQHLWQFRHSLKHELTK